MLRFKAYMNLLLEASEGDAYKYMKKVLLALPNADELAADYGENWTREIFNKLRNDFVHAGCDVYFIPGIARIVYGELDYDSEDEDTAKIRQLRSIVKFITIAHKGQFNRYLAHINDDKSISNPFTFEQLQSMFNKNIKHSADIERNNFKNSNKNANKTNYTVIWLKDFETAHKYLKYCTANSWCYFEDEGTFDTYARSGNKLYLALAPGFEKLKPGDPGYGRSMIGFDMEPQDENGISHLGVCNNRYNHATDLEHENDKSGDSKYDEIELSEILGVPVWEAYPGYTEEEAEQMGLMTINKTLNEVREIFLSANSDADIIYNIYKFLENRAADDETDMNVNGIDFSSYSMYYDFDRDYSKEEFIERNSDESFDLQAKDDIYNIELYIGSYYNACFDAKQKRFLQDFTKAE